MNHLLHGVAEPVELLEGGIDAGRNSNPTEFLVDDGSGQDAVLLPQPGVERARFHVFNRAGHYAFREHAAEVNRLITSFVAEAVAV